MSSKKLTLRCLGGVLLVAALVGCGSPTPTLAPTVDFQPTLIAVQAQAVRTVIANLTQNAPTATQVPPVTATAVSTSTATPVPSNTPLPTATTTATYIPWTLTPSATLNPFRCAVTDVSPKANTSFDAKSDFDATWVIKNTGEEKWVQSDVDILYSSGTKLQEAGSGLDLKNDVASGESYTVVVDMRAPADAGTYSTTWAVVRGSQVICSMSLTIIVK
jgi:hypothetical protein